MRRSVIAVAILLLAAAAVQPPTVRYRLGRAPRAEFKVAGQTFKIDPNATHVKRVRALPSEEFDPVRRHDRVPDFYRSVLKERYDEFARLPRHHCGPFRWEFVYWTTRWPMALRARWAWAHRRYVEDLLWSQWMADAEFAAQIRMLQAQNAPVQDGYLPPEYANTSPAFIYSDEYLDAAYNPVPFLAVMNLTSLKADPQSDWIGKAAAQSLVANLSAMPGMYVVENDRVAGALAGDEKVPYVDATDPLQAAQVARKLEAEQVVVGNYVVDGDKVLFNLRIVDAESGKVVGGISKSVARDHLLEALPEFASALAGSLTPHTSVAVAPPQAPAPAPGGTQDPSSHRRTTRTHVSNNMDLPAGAVESEMVGGHGGGAFCHVDPVDANSPVVGFRWSLGHWSGRDVLRQLDPIYADAPGTDDGHTQTIMARDGYVVGGLIVDTDGLNAVAARVLFVRWRDGRLDPTSRYTSDWIGGEPSHMTVRYLGGHGERVLGTFGHKGMNLDAVGLVLSAPYNDAVAPNRPMK